MASKETTPRRSGSSDPDGAPTTPGWEDPHNNPRGQGPSPDSFEPLYKRLEEIVARLEQGDLTLEESLSLYEEGMKLARRCQEMLQSAELRITRLQESVAEGLGTVREEPAEYEPDAEEQGLPLE